VAGTPGCLGQFPAVEEEGSHADAAADQQQQTIIADLGSGHRIAEGTEEIDGVAGTKRGHRSGYRSDHLHQQVYLVSIRPRLGLEVVDAEGAPDEGIVTVADPNLEELAGSDERSEVWCLDLEAIPPLTEIDIGQHRATVDARSGRRLGSHLIASSRFSAALGRDP